MKKLSIRFASTTALLALLSIPMSGAGQDIDGRWLPFVGCWEAVGSDAVGEDGQLQDGGLLCFVPDAGGVELRNIVDGETVSTERLAADGVQRDISAEGCEGWESLTFSEDGRRVFTTTEFSCGTDAVRSGSGVMAFTTPASWADVRSLNIDGEAVSWVQDYEVVSAERLAAEGVTDPAADLGMAVRSGRMAASAPIDLGDVAEAAARVDAKAVESWVVVGGNPLDPSAKDLIEMADNGVPSNVIDVVVAVSHPDRFVVEAGGEIAPDAPAAQHYRGYMAYNPFWGPRWGFQRYASPWGSRYGAYGNRYGYGYGAWDYGYGYYGSRPGVIVIDRRSNGGSVQSGRGYRSGASTSRPATRRGGSQPSYGTGSSRSGDGASGSTRSGSDRPARRTARRRPSGG